MIQCENSPFQAEDVVLRNLKEKTVLNCERDWASIRGLVCKVAGVWTAEYDSTIREERARGFEFPSSELRHEHCQRLDRLLSYGCDLLLIIHSVEDKSDPPVELADLERKLVYALRSVKIARSAYSVSTESMSVRLVGVLA